MSTDTERDREVADWNAALASGDQARIDETRDRLLASVHTRIMNDDPQYAVAGWKP